MPFIIQGIVKKQVTLFIVLMTQLEAKEQNVESTLLYLEK